LTDYDDFDEDPPIPSFLPPQADIARAATAARLQAAEDALALRQATNPRSRSERFRAQAAAASIPLPSGDDPALSAALFVVEPNSYKKVMKSPDKDH
jgi:hypothetical protein